MLIKKQGLIVEEVIRTRGINLIKLSQALKIDRQKLYLWFNASYLDKDIIHLIGITIHHDFSKEFPELFTTKDFLNHRFIDRMGNDSQCSCSNQIN